VEPFSVIIDVWTIEHDPREDLAGLEPSLSPEEIARVDRLRVPEKRALFVYNRALLRKILASYLEVSASKVPLVTSPHGKPLLGNVDRGLKLAFNLAHCRDLALLAISRGASVGIDVEALDTAANYDALATQALSPDELVSYQRLPPGERPAAVLRAWTRKEAYLKAVGCGFARPLCDIQVTFLEGEPPRLLDTGDPQDSSANWSLRCWSPRPGWFATVAALHDGSELHIDWKSAASLRDRSTSPREPVARIVTAAI
jgi:4'-phosphopantetheinyl transferase